MGVAQHTAVLSSRPIQKARARALTCKSIGDGPRDQGNLVQSVGDPIRGLARRHSKGGVGANGTVLGEEAGRVVSAVAIPGDADPRVAKRVADMVHDCLKNGVNHIGEGPPRVEIKVWI